jgi:hypothetical protein
MSSTSGNRVFVRQRLTLHTVLLGAPVPLFLAPEAASILNIGLRLGVVVSNIHGSYGKGEEVEQETQMSIE